MHKFKQYIADLKHSRLFYKRFITPKEWFHSFILDYCIKNFSYIRYKILDGWMDGCKSWFKNCIHRHIQCSNISSDTIREGGVAAGNCLNCYSMYCLTQSIKLSWEDNRVFWAPKSWSKYTTLWQKLIKYCVTCKQSWIPMILVIKSVIVFS